MKYHIWTVGCQMNQADSLKLAAGLDRLGHVAVDAPEQADVVVVNTCSVRQGAEDRAYAKLGTLAQLKQSNPGLKVAVMGCMVGPRTVQLERRFRQVDVFAQPQRFDPIVELFGDGNGGSADLGGEFWPEAVMRPAGPTAFVPVIHGCNKFCTYCIVPYRRGREKSVPIAGVRREVAGLVARGVREVTLLGQTVEAYGKDQPEKPDLSDLMRELSEIDGLWRIRYLTSYPRDMTERIIAGTAELPKVCESFSLPVQSGDDDVLIAMRRGYRLSLFLERMELVRRYMPEAGISTDVIVGFPGETDAQFQRTYDLLAALRFDKVHVAEYSPRPGTIAWRTQPDDVPAAVKHERLLAVETLQERIATEINARLLGTEQELLVEGKSGGRWTGRTRSNKLVHLEGEAAPGEKVRARITSTGPWSLRGERAGVAAVVRGETPEPTSRDRAVSPAR